MHLSGKGLIIGEYNEDIGSCVCLLGPDHWKRAIGATSWDLAQKKKKKSSIVQQMSEMNTQKPYFLEHHFM